MGAWGYEPLDSDQALDWLWEYVTGPIGDEITDLLDRFDKTVARGGIVEATDLYGLEIRAAAFVVETLNFFPFELDLHQRLHDALCAMKDGGWHERWRDPEAVRIELQKQIDAMAAQSGWTF